MHPGAHGEGGRRERIPTARIKFDGQLATKIGKEEKRGQKFSPGGRNIIVVLKDQANRLKTKNYEIHCILPKIH